MERPSGAPSSRKPSTAQPRAHLDQWGARQAGEARTRWGEPATRTSWRPVATRTHRRRPCPEERAPLPRPGDLARILPGMTAGPGHRSIVWILQATATSVGVIGWRAAICAQLVRQSGGPSASFKVTGFRIGKVGGPRRGKARTAGKGSRGPVIRRTSPVPSAARGGAAFAAVRRRGARPRPGLSNVPNGIASVEAWSRTTGPRQVSALRPRHSGRMGRM